MEFKVKDMDIATGDVQIVLLNQIDTDRLDLHHMDRLEVWSGKRKTIAVLDIAESSKAVKPGVIGLFEEVLKALDVKQNNIVKIKVAERPKSIGFIRKKLEGKELTKPEINAIVRDIVNDQLTYIELTSYVTGNYANGMSDREIVDLTEAMVATGIKLKKAAKVVCDLHSIGGVPGNRTTMIVVPIIAAAGLKIPKTSSRAITSPAGTADTMEVFAPVALNKRKLERLIRDHNGCIVWGGAINLAPADEKIIRIEHPLKIDAEGQMLASIMAKKASVRSTHLLLELPIGKGTKVTNRKHAAHLKRSFERLGRKLGIKMCTSITEERQPIGNGIGPVLEARDVLWVLQNDPCQPLDLRKKSLRLAGQLLEFAGGAKKGEGLRKATKLLNSGAAHTSFDNIVKGQGGRLKTPGELRPGAYKFNVRSPKTGRVKSIDNMEISRIARFAGCPRDKRAGVYLYKHVGDRIKKGDLLFTIYAHSKRYLQSAVSSWKERGGILVR